MCARTTTQAVEDYLKTILKLQSDSERVSTTGIAEHLGVTPASATGMIKKLSRMKLVEYRPYHGVKLTPKGKGIALEILRHHRLVESYLAEALGVPWDQVDAEAEKLEHVLSDDLEARMDAFLGHPKIDPHGAPIPTVNGHIPSSASRRLTDLAPGQSAVIASVSDHDPEMLRYFAEIGIALKRELQVVDIASLEGRITLRLGGENLVLGCEVAQYIFVDEVG